MSNDNKFFNSLAKSCVILMAMMSLMLSGCITKFGVIDGGLTSTSHRPSQPLLTENLLAIGKPDAATSHLLGVQDALALVGAQKTYVFTKGGGKLFELAQAFQLNLALNAERLVLIDDFDRADKKLFLDNDTAWGKVEFNYQPLSNGTYSQEEQQALEKIGFTLKKNAQSQNLYKLIIDVEAAVKPVIKLSNANIPNLKKSRTLTFYEPDSKTLVSKPKLGRILLLPFSVAADIVTSPIQLLGLGAFAWIMKDPHIVF